MSIAKLNNVLHKKFGKHIYQYMYLFSLIVILIAIGSLIIAHRAEQKAEKEHLAQQKALQAIRAKNSSNDTKKAKSSNNSPSGSSAPTPNNIASSAKPSVDCAAIMKQTRALDVQINDSAYNLYLGQKNDVLTSPYYENLSASEKQNRIDSFYIQYQNQLSIHRAKSSQDAYSVGCSRYFDATAFSPRAK